jgi:hypothetical protein
VQFLDGRAMPVTVASLRGLGRADQRGRQQAAGHQGRDAESAGGTLI